MLNLDKAQQYNRVPTAYQGHPMQQEVQVILANQSYIQELFFPNPVFSLMTWLDFANIFFSDFIWRNWGAPEHTFLLHKTKFKMKEDVKQQRAKGKGAEGKGKIRGQKRGQGQGQNHKLIFCPYYHTTRWYSLVDQFFFLQKVRRKLIFQNILLYYQVV